MKYFQDLLAARPRGETGGKARGLRRLALAGFPVPPTWVVAAGDAGKYGSPAFRGEFSGLFPSGPVIVRSSAAGEDGEKASFAGVYESAVARGPAGLSGAVRKCLASGRGPAARAYRRLTGAGGGGLALVFQPFLEAEYGGVGVVEPGRRVIVELARGGSGGVTAGRAQVYRLTLDTAERRLTLPQGCPLGRPAALALLSELARLSRALYPGRGVTAEFLLRGGRPLWLQARPLRLAGSEPVVDMVSVYRKIVAAMTALGLKDGDWSLAETADVAAFNFLNIARPASERLEHFRVRLTPAGKARAAAGRWFNAKYDGDDDTFFPADLAAPARRRLDALAREGLFLMFVLPKPGEEVLKRVLRPAPGLSVPFSYTFEGMEKEEERALARLPAAEAAALLCRLARERDIWRRLRAAPAKNAYGRRLAFYAGRELLLAAKKARLAGRSGARPAPGLRGKPFRPADGVATGPAVTREGMARGRGPAIYFGYDLEPCFLPYARRLRAAVVSRGAFGSHAAQLCGELGIPLVVEAAGAGRVRDGDLAAVDLRTGEVRLLARGRRP